MTDLFEPAMPASADTGPAEVLLRQAMAMGVVDVAGLVRRGARLQSSASRHANTRLVDRDGGGVFLKRGDGDTGFGTVAHEAAAYETLAALIPAGAPLTTPRAIAYDAADDLLALTLVPGARRLADVALAGEPLGAHPARLGAALGALHALDPQAAPARGLPVHRGTTIFHLDAPSVETFCRLSRGQIELIATLQAHRTIIAPLVAMAADWRADRVVHFDIRLANALVVADELTLIDFEYLGIGDPRWDLAGLLAAFVETWLMSAPLGDPAGFERHLDRARFTAPAACAAIQSAWGAYAAAPGAPRFAVAQVAPFVGARLILAAYEHAAGLSEPNARVATLAAMGAEFLEHPAEAAAGRLGLSDQPLSQ